MNTTAGLSLPSLDRGRFAFQGSESAINEITVLTDNRLFEETGVRIAFTERSGGLSVGPYASLNLGTHVDDDHSTVIRNRERLLGALGAQNARLVSFTQIHGDNVVEIPADDKIALNMAAAQARDGADAVVVGAQEVAPLLCFADCLPLIIVAPNKTFAISHCGWRGLVANVATKTLGVMRDRFGVDPAQCNAYIGPYIHVECFEVGEEVAHTFEEAFGRDCLMDDRHVDLGRALRIELDRCGLVQERIADVDACTVCDNDRFYSYRGQSGVCGRHSALAVRLS